MEIHYDTPMIFNGLTVVVSAKNRLTFDFGTTTITTPFVAGGIADIVAILRTPNFDEQLIVLEQQQLAGKTRIDLTPEHAPLTVRLKAEDENGNALSAPTSFCDEHHTIEFPSNSQLSWVALVQSAQRSFRTSPLSSRITFTSMKDCRDETTHRYYLAQFPAMRGLDAPVTQTFSAANWIRQPVRMLVPPGTVDPGFKSTLVGAITSNGGGFLAEAFPSSPRDMDSDLWSGTFFFSAAPGGMVSYYFGPELWAKPPRGTVSSAITAPRLRLFDDRVVPTFGWWGASPADYHVPAASTLTFGDAPVHPNGVIRATGTALSTSLSWIGPAGEWRQIDGWTGTSTLSDATGTVIRSGPWSGPLPGPGIYRLRATNTNVAVGPARGTATYDGTFDTRNGETSLAMFKALRIVDGHGVQTSRVSRGQAATLVFAIELHEMGELRPGNEAVRAEYRAHGTSEWRALTPVLVAEQGVSVFHADLSAATATIQGTVDLRLSVQSPGENHIEYVVEPAFAIGAVPRRRPVRH